MCSSYRGELTIKFFGVKRFRLRNLLSRFSQALSRICSMKRLRIFKGVKKFEIEGKQEVRGGKILVNAMLF